MRVLITGAAGFLGSHLSTRYLNTGHEVFGVDDFTSSDADSPHLKRLLAHPYFRFIERDIRSKEAFVGLLRFDPFDLVLNFACPASPPLYQSMPIKTLLTSVVGGSNMLDLAVHHGARFLQASTSEVYGDPLTSPQRETFRGNVNCYGPRACYDEGKRALEALCFDYERLHKLDVKIVRIFNTFGPHMRERDGRVVSNFICQALRGKPLTVYGGGTQTRSLCYVDDLVDGIVKLAESGDEVKGPVNIGDPRAEMSVFDLARKVLELTGSLSPICYEPLPVDDPQDRVPDVTRARVLLGWQPRVSIDDALNATIEHFKRAIDGER